MTVLNLPYILPLFLGMTFDARNTRAGVDIFNQKDVNDPAVTVMGRTTSRYRITSSLSDVLDTLDVSGDLALKIKSGMLNIEGKGSYLKNSNDYKNRVEIITHLEYISKTESFKDGVAPVPGWAEHFNTGVLGTHFVSGVTYGAELIASARFIVHNSSETEDVKGAINAAFGSDGNGTQLVVEGKLEKLAKKLAHKANLEISYFGTVPIKSIPNNIEGLRTLIEGFSQQIEDAGLKDGIPMGVELTPLSEIADPEEVDRFEFLLNQDLQDQMDEFEEQMDELRQARLDLTAWAKALPYDVDREVEKEVGLLLKKITSTLEKFYSVVWTLDLTKGEEQLEPAFETYDYDGEGIYLRFDKMVRKLKARLEPLIRRDVVSSDTYIHYGNNRCTGNNAQTLYEGYVISSEMGGNGGSAGYDCMPLTPKGTYDLYDKSRKSSFSVKRYTKLSKEFNPFKGSFAKTMAEEGVPCAKCYSPDAHAVALFTSSTKCPLYWEVMYKGYLMSSYKDTGRSTMYVCVDEEPSKAHKMGSEPHIRDTLALTVVHSGGSLPRETYIDGALVRCVVCAMKGNQIVG